jgi:hypothetical protein
MNRFDGVKNNKKKETAELHNCRLPFTKSSVEIINSLFVWTDRQNLFLLRVFLQ